MNFDKGKSPLNKANFTANYEKLRENTILKKQIDQTETLLPDKGHHQPKQFSRKLKNSGQMIVGL